MNVVGIDPGLADGVAIVDEHGVVSLVDDLRTHRLAPERENRVRVGPPITAADFGLQPD
jgi:hypothetical protein